MKKWLSIALLSCSFIYNAQAVLPLPANVIDFTSSSGQKLLKRSANDTTLSLLQNYLTQDSVTFCNVASATIILNALNVPPPDDLQHKPFKYFTQENFFTDEVAKIAKKEDVAKSGMTLDQLAAAINTHGVHATAYHANQLSLDKTRTMIKDALQHNKPVIANLLRTGISEQGGGHHSPVAAYDKESDRFLFLDVARYKYHACWVKASDLYKAMNTMDGNASRGFIVIEK
ncbi:phytochelatin synthase family protein [Legionella sp. km772]|uniref:phytochelatin synthase family protein n=1 Tax=Legionella sp. km772 TaxID=2498111 RepID=UPI000F8F7CE8|nr:phytochelatin synthase family protein [Legionella sp. km772]RUR05032.1 glutathione gamma-glutamylcysteinyltransferase [Legionella sp. km772]